MGGIWERVFAVSYDPFLWLTEKRCLGQFRRELLSGLSGRVLEIGAGTGANLPYYPRDLNRLVLSEPARSMAKGLRRKLAKQTLAAELVFAGAEALPFASDSFDAVVATLTLCTVPNPEQALVEIQRVLVPGGRFCFLEHVRAEEPRLAHWQDRIAPYWQAFGCGCRCNRETLELIKASELSPESVVRTDIKGALPIVKPMIVGSALR